MFRDVVFNDKNPGLAKLSKRASISLPAANMANHRRRRRHLPADDEALGRGSDIRERITGHQRQQVFGRGSQYRDIVRLDDEERVNDVFEIAIRRGELNLILGPQVL